MSQENIVSNHSTTFNLNDNIFKHYVLPLTLFKTKIIIVIIVIRIIRYTPYKCKKINHMQSLEQESVN